VTARRVSGLEKPEVLLALALVPLWALWAQAASSRAASQVAALQVVLQLALQVASSQSALQVASQAASLVASSRESVARLRVAQRRLLARPRWPRL
jgi:hypothetical protein